ncbi:5-oxoprolinase subunit B family protein [Fimbriimonas ginsengisoli]|uniref:Allophanate hydrolase subunit 1 n=1 Tax=Fimbriimonas ginsengisoli Gsoil 348 TaxID=661478 RepID=A0A068NPG9_FIMGI|nr:allophanate hydrolase subunit 1 [Fimbriimonas ginsengisoli]AIE85453.1 Allophanate hydrolase subunit 1 [Fimbriimonas ginsengisoli Gsoil 348]
MKIEPLGDAAYLVRELEGPAYEIAAALNSRGLPGLTEAVASYDTLGLYVDPDQFDPSSFSTSLGIVAPRAGRSHEIPVCYELGVDLDEAAARLAIAPDELVKRHAEPSYRCYAVGFCPGFPYLGYLDDAIAGLPRRPSPRVRVEPGSVAITGRQTGIYPLPRPGGWWLIGRTPLKIVDPDTRYFPIEAGDEVRFVPISRDEFDEREGERL